MSKRVRFLILLILVFAIYKLFVHTSCGGEKGIPWWPNSNCTCLGFLSGPINDMLGSKAKYCIGILR